MIDKWTSKKSVYENWISNRMFGSLFIFSFKITYIFETWNMNQEYYKPGKVKKYISHWDLKVCESPLHFLLQFVAVCCGTKITKACIITARENFICRDLWVRGEFWMTCKVYYWYTVCVLKKYMKTNLRKW